MRFPIVPTRPSAARGPSARSTPSAQCKVSDEHSQPGAHCRPTGSGAQTRPSSSPHSTKPLTAIAETPTLEIAGRRLGGLRGRRAGFVSNSGTEDHTPSFSPDGQTIIFMRSNNTTRRRSRPAPQRRGDLHDRARRLRPSAADPPSGKRLRRQLVAQRAKDRLLAKRAGLAEGRPLRDARQRLAHPAPDPLLATRQPQRRLGRRPSVAPQFTEPPCCRAWIALGQSDGSDVAGVPASRLG